jgi:predicted alpha/beta hydrolase
MKELITEREVRFAARDGYSLSGLVIAPECPKAAVLVSSGTGFPKELYRRIARCGASMGYACLLYDYRGITGSAPQKMREFQADIIDWARLDFAAALDEAAVLARDKPLFTLGHSVGGHLLGFAENADLPRANAFISAGSGYWGGHEWSYRNQALFFWLLYGPLCLAIKGYIPADGAWGGTALPAGIFKQWREWAFKPGYFGDMLDQLGPHHFDTLKAPIRNWGFTDDRLASKAAMASLMGIYSVAPQETIRLKPGELGVERIDHFGIFKRQGEMFWPKPFEWFDEFIES